jgi:lupus La protein
MTNAVKQVEAEATQLPALDSTAEQVDQKEQSTEIKSTDPVEEITKSEDVSLIEAASTEEKHSEDPTTQAKDQKADVKSDERDDSLKRKRNDDDNSVRNRKPHQKSYKNYRDNIKSRFDDLPESSDPSEIREQVEFYFSDHNIIRDDYLFQQTGGADNNPIPIKTIHSFKRMRHFQPYSALVEALKESNFLEVVDGDQVKRKKPLVLQPNMSRSENIEWFENEASKRTLYAKGFGEETKTTQLDIEEFFRPYGPINAVRLRRSFPDKVFKGSVFVEFESEESMQQYLDLEPHPKWQDEIELKLLTKKAYCDGKVEDIRAGRIQPNQNDQRGHNRDNRGRGRQDGGRGRGRGRGGHRRDDRGGGRNRSRSPFRRNHDGNDWKGRRDDFQKGGYRDRGDRNGKNDNRGRDRHNNGERKEQDVDEKYVTTID